MLFACGSDHPTLTHFKAFDERFTTVIDTSDASTLTALGDLFYNRQEVTGAEGDLEFLYLIDITHAGGSERWRCTKKGYCQQRLEGTEPNRKMFYVERYKELFDLAKLN